MKTLNQPAILVFKYLLWIFVCGTLLLFTGLFPVDAAPIPIEDGAHAVRVPLQSSGSLVGRLSLQVDTEIPDGSNYRWQPLFTGLAKPVELLSPPGEPEKMVIVEQGGTIRLVINRTVSSELFLDIRDRVGSSANEQGLLGLAFDPDYVVNRYFYVNYTDRNGDTVIARFTSAEDKLRADARSEVRLMQIDQPYDNHNGGGLAFGPDGYLYIGLGDGGSAGDPQNNAQNLNSLLGKLLRIDVNTPDGYAIPVDNPFANGGGKAEIWAYGLRNPWRFSFDALSGDLWIADVGQKLWEEVDFLPGGSAGGANFGWNIMEGSHPYKAGATAAASLVNPIYEYDHNTGCSITGGFVYRGDAMPEWQGIYLFGDYCQGTIYGLSRTSTGVSAKLVGRIDGNISSFGLDGNGEIYALDHSRGTVYRFEPR